ncbi:hypothetical protein [Actinomadura fibrosa]|uniref:Serine/arginine repetitive matrix protein 2 n=2 Tax=Actinomadura fibrosa TaxID=111802 RepID=A0ABW2XKM3_9ACTN
MWPGANIGPPPMDPGPAGAPWTAPPRVKPSAGWYTVPIVLAATAVVGLVIMLVLFLDDSMAAEKPGVTGGASTGVTVDLEAGRGYFLYVRTGASAPTSCALRAYGQTGAVELTRKNSWAQSDHTGYRYTASFQAPVGGEGVLTCRGTSGTMLVTPDDTADFYLGLSVLIGVVCGVLAIVGFVFLFVRRSHARRAAVSSVPGAFPY